MPGPYIKQEWADGDSSKPLSATRLNYIEEGIETAQETADQVPAVPSGELGGTWASTTIDTAHAEGSHSSMIATHAAAADPHAIYILKALFNAKGDLIGATADNTPVVVSGGATDGYVLTYEAAQAAGFKWAAAPGAAGGIPASLFDAAGDLIVASAADVAARLARGTVDGMAVCVDVASTSKLKYKHSAGSTVYNVKDYGAAGNFTTDDTAAIQAAIDACTVAGGGTVFFPRGRYKITAFLTWKAGCHMEGDTGTGSVKDRCTEIYWFGNLTDPMCKTDDIGGNIAARMMENLTWRARNDANAAAATISYGATTVTNTAEGWTTNEWAGARVSATNGATGVVTSNTATVLTLSGGWTGGTPTGGAGGHGYHVAFAPNGIIDCLDRSDSGFQFKRVWFQHSGSYGVRHTLGGINVWYEDCRWDHITSYGIDWVLQNTAFDNLTITNQEVDNQWSHGSTAGGLLRVNATAATSTNRFTGHFQGMKLEANKEYASTDTEAMFLFEGPAENASRNLWGLDFTGCHVYPGAAADDDDYMGVRFTPETEGVSLIATNCTLNYKGLAGFQEGTQMSSGANASRRACPLFVYSPLNAWSAEGDNSLYHSPAAELYGSVNHHGPAYFLGGLENKEIQAPIVGTSAPWSTNPTTIPVGTKLVATTYSSGMASLVRSHCVVEGTLGNSTTYWSGVTVSSGGVSGTSTVVLSSIPANMKHRHWITIDTQSRRIVHFNRTTNTVTVQTPWSPSVAGGSAVTFTAPTFKTETVTLT